MSEQELPEVSAEEIAAVEAAVGAPEFQGVDGLPVEPEKGA